MNYQEIKSDPAIRTYITEADASLSALGYTEHSFPHATAVARTAGDILETLGYPERTVELARIAGYLHDIGNLVNRLDHSQSGAVMEFFEIFLDRMILCRKAAQKLGLQFRIVINGQSLL